MRPFVGMLTLLLMINHLQVSAQEESPYCGWIKSEINVKKSDNTPCFDMDYVYKNCIPVYVRVNLHFFVNDKCNGLVQQMNKIQKDVYGIAEEMIYYANKTFENNEAQWQVVGAVAPCVPVRLVLKGIHMHCKSDAVGIVNTIELNEQFGVNKTTEINFYIADTDIGASGIGYHLDRSGSATFFNKESWWTIGNFVHELGHILNLDHSFSTDDCDDTPQIKFNWDKNCNGIFERSSNKDENEKDLTCWNKIEANKNKGEEGFSDINKNLVHDCNEKNPCTECPCCRQEFIDNNVMSYSAIKSALTECQVKLMLEDLSEFNCGLIEKIGDCPPATAFITQIPEDLKDESKCKECLILEASTNEEEYELKIYKRINGQEQLVYNGGKIIGQAQNFCYKTGTAFEGLKNYLEHETKYVAYLVTKNSCSEDLFEYEFITNSSDCNSVQYESLAITPNPGVNLINVEFESQVIGEKLECIAKELITGNHYVVFHNHISKLGMNRIDLDVTHLPEGIFKLTIVGENSIFQNTFIKM
jgi:hypothetical protein